MIPTSEDCDAAIAALDSLLDLEPATVTIGPEENKRLLALAFACDEAPTRPNTDDEITIDAPSPVAHVAARVAQRPPPLKALVLTSPPPARQASPVAVTGVAAPVSERRSRITPAFALTKTDPQHLVVAGIWAMALSLMATLAFIVMA